MISTVKIAYNEDLCVKEIHHCERQSLLQVKMITILIQKLTTHEPRSEVV